MVDALTRPRWLLASVLLCLAAGAGCDPRGPAAPTVPEPTDVGDGSLTTDRAEYVLTPVGVEQAAVTISFRYVNKTSGPVWVSMTCGELTKAFLEKWVDTRWVFSHGAGGNCLGGSDPPHLTIEPGASYTFAQRYEPGPGGEDGFPKPIPGTYRAVWPVYSPQAAATLPEPAIVSNLFTLRW